jgi:hypothetical protein
MASIIAHIIKSSESLLLSVVRIFVSPSLVVFPADLISIPPLSSLEALYFFYEVRLSGGRPRNISPRGYLWEVPVRPWVYARCIYRPAA